MSPLDERADVARFERVGLQQGLILTIGALVIFADGFDAQMVSYVAPALAKSWRLHKGDFANVFAANVTGLMLGGVLITPLADQFSRRRVTLVCIGLIGLFSWLPLLTHNLAQLTWARFATGLVLGGAMPCMFATVADYLPRRVGVRLTVLLSCAYSLGILVCGLVTGAVIFQQGWRAMFVLGAILPIVLLPFAALYLAESPAYLIARGRLGDLRRIVERMGGTVCEDAASRPRLSSPLQLLFVGRFALVTPLIWLAYFCTGATIYFFLNWLPILMTSMGLDARQAAFTSSIYQTGGLFGGLLIGYLVDRFGGWAIALSLTAAAIIVALIGTVSGALAALAAAGFLAGFLVVGCQNALHAFVGGRLYPSETRATGLGWALGSLRLSGVLAGSLGAGFLINLDLGPRRTFMIIAVPELIAALSLVAITYVARSGAAKSADAI